MTPEAPGSAPDRRTRTPQRPRAYAALAAASALLAAAGVAGTLLLAR